jgi:hypothetical protein
MLDFCNTGQETAQRGIDDRRQLLETKYWACQRKHSVTLSAENSVGKVNPVAFAELKA